MVFVDDVVAGLQVAEVRQERANDVPSLVDMDLFGEDIAIREQGQPAVGKLHPTGEMPRPDFDARFLSGGDAAFEEGFRQTLGAAGGAEQNEGLSGRSP